MPHAGVVERLPAGKLRQRTGDRIVSTRCASRSVARAILEPAHDSSTFPLDASEIGERAHETNRSGTPRGRATAGIPTALTERECRSMLPLCADRRARAKAALSTPRRQVRENPTIGPHGISERIP